MRAILIVIIELVFVHVLLAADPQNQSWPDVISGILSTEPTTSITKQPKRRSEADKYRSCGLDKECVPRFLCQNETVNTDGANIIDIRAQYEDCGYLELCCDIPNKRDLPVIDPVPPIRHEGCGYRNPLGIGYRLKGAAQNEAEFGEFPWMVAILREEEVRGQIRYEYECGGALIAPNVVLTAAHCVKNRVPNKIFIRAGEWDTQTEAEILPSQDEVVSEIIVHEKYNNGSLWNDIALVFMENSFKLEENIRPVCLPPHDANFDYARCYTTGWGKDKFGREGIYQTILKRIDLPIVPHNQCQTNLRATRLGRYFRLHESFICAGGERGKDACTGDGGSPLVCPINGVKDRFYQAGIVAWGIGCNEENIPGVYASIAHLRPWIDYHLNAKGINFAYFTT